MSGKTQESWEFHPFHTVNVLSDEDLTTVLQERFRASLTVLIAGQLGRSSAPPLLSSRSVWQRALPQWEAWQRPGAKDYLLLQGTVWIRAALAWLSLRTGADVREHGGEFRLSGLDDEAERRILRALQTKGFRTLAVFTNQLQLPNLHN